MGDLALRGRWKRPRSTANAIMRAVAERGVRTSIVRPSTAYGHGGYVPLLLAPQNGVVHYFGDGENRWSVVHADELGEFYRLTTARAPAGSVYNAASGVVRVRDAAEAAAAAAGARVVPWPREETEQTWGWWVGAFRAITSPRSNVLATGSAGHPAGLA